jgi:hypothetical protein
MLHTKYYSYNKFLQVRVRMNSQIRRRTQKKEKFTSTSNKI